jgi:hypothetical protein
MLRQDAQQKSGQREDKKPAGVTTVSAMTEEELKLEAELQREEIKLKLRNADGSIPPGPKRPNIRSEEHRPALNPKTAYYGEQVADWLNQSKGTPEHRRIIDVMADVEAARESAPGPYWQTSVVVGGRSFSGGIPKQVTEGDGEYEKRLSRLRRKSRSYSFYPAFHYPLERHWVGSLVPIGKRTPRSQVRLGEHEAIWWLFEIAMDGEWERLRPCGCGCGAWLFARRLDRRFLEDHRQTAYRKSTKFKKHRAAWMRNYRSQQKKRGEKALIEARRGLKSRR